MQDFNELTQGQKKKFEEWSAYEQQLEEEFRAQRAEKGFSEADVNNICYWFLNVIPEILTEMRENLRSFPDTKERMISTSPSHHVIMPGEDYTGIKPYDEWVETLDKLIHLAKEMREETCSFKNKYEETHHKIHNEFAEKYGFFGEALMTPEEKAAEEKGEGKRVYFPSDVKEHPEWAELEEAYRAERNNITHYRDRCREEFFALFSQVFWDLMN